MKRLSVFIKSYVFAALSSLYLFTAGVFVARHRAWLLQICKHFGYNPEPPRTPCLIPVIALAEVVPENIDFQLRAAVRTGGNTSLLETVTIAKLVRANSPRTLFEIGTFDGRTTVNMAANSPADSRVYTLDLPREQLNATELPLEPGDHLWIDKEISGARYRGTDVEGKITQLYGDSALFDFSPYFGAVDFIFIDGSHSYEYVLKDSETALRLLRDGRGVIVWHDYGPCEGATRALNELYAQGGVFQGLRRIEGTSLGYLRLT